ncbi:MAG: sulfotransferase [Alphaproteobacteria bacterium]|nr:sulfotransferase [Alphaproteobacteria bacterium]
MRPSTVWLLNRLGGALSAVGLGVPLEPERLMSDARRRAGLSDFGAWEYPEALDVACRSLDEDAQLSPFGRLAMREMLISTLEMRLRLVQLRAEAPERLQGPVPRPIVILGLPRTGTTLLHRLLGETPGLRALRTWEVFTPLSPRSAAQRRAETAALLGIIRRLAPGVDAKHALDPDEPEEEIGLFAASLWSPTLWRMARTYSYKRWQLSADPLPAYRVFREKLALIQAEQPEARLVLKLPNHTAFVEALLTVLPDALLLRMHRDPVPVVASYCSLAESMHGVYSEAQDRAGLGRASLALWRHHHEAFAAAAIPEAQLLEFDYEQVRADPVAAALEVLGRAAHPVDEAAEARLRAVAAARPQHAHGQHAYRLEDFNLDPAQVREALPR